MEYDVSTSRDMTVGTILAAQDDLAGSTDTLREGIAVAEHLLSRDPANAGWQRHAALLHSSLGNGLTMRGDTAGALSELEASLVSFEKAAAAAPEDAGRQHDVAGGPAGHRHQPVRSGKLPWRRRTPSRGPRDRRTAGGARPGQRGGASSLADFRTVLGDALAQEGDTTGALALFDADRGDSERLARLHPENGQWQQERSR